MALIFNTAFYSTLLAPVPLLVVGTEGNDTLNDLLNGADPATNDTINAFGGQDLITVYNGNDTVNAGEGRDMMYDFGTGNDTFNGEGGDDFLYIGKGNDIFNGGAGRDGVSYLFSEQIVSADLQSGWALSEGIDQLISVEDLSGGLGNDILKGSTANNYIYGGQKGDDTIEGRDGNDTLNGGTGYDKVFGGNGADTVQGEYGNDTLNGGAGNDVVWGGMGDDVMTGGTESDRFYFTSKSDIQNYDTITDFQHGIDKIDLRGIDARRDIAGNQAFTFDSTPDGSVEEFFDGLDDPGYILWNPGPWINGDTGEVEYRHSGGKTYVYLSYADEKVQCSLVLNGTVNLTASDFYL